MLDITHKFASLVSVIFLVVKSTFEFLFFASVFCGMYRFLMPHPLCEYDKFFLDKCTCQGKLVIFSIYTTKKNLPMKNISRTTCKLVCGH